MTTYGQFQFLSPENSFNSKIECYVKIKISILYQYKQNIWKENYKSSIEKGIFRKWQRFTV